MLAASPDMSRTSTTAEQRATPSPSTSKRGTSQASAGSPEASESQPLLTPVVRSKRTPIACTECRRRQVKCTGGTPQCERCEKRGVKCEYIPCSQQKAASSTGSPTPPALPERQMHSPMSFYSSHSSHSSTTPWQQSDPSHPDYFHDGRTSYEQRNDWRHHVYGPISSDAQLVQSNFNGVPAQQRNTDVAFSRDVYNQDTYGYHTYGQPGLPPTAASHQAYTGVSFPSGYVTSDVHAGSGDHSLPFGYGSANGRTSLLDHAPPHRSPHSGQFMQGGNALHNSLLVGLPLDVTNQDWTSNSAYVPYQGARHS